MRWFLIFLLLFLPGCDTLKGATAGLLDVNGWVWNGSGWVVKKVGQGVEWTGEGMQWLGDKSHEGANSLRGLGKPEVAQARPNARTPPPPRHFQAQQMATCQALQAENPHLVCTADGIGQACNNLRAGQETAHLYSQAMRGAAGDPQFEAIRNLCTPVVQR